MFNCFGEFSSYKYFYVKYKVIINGCKDKEERERRNFVVDDFGYILEFDIESVGCEMIWFFWWV